MTQKDQNSIANKEPNFIDPVSLAKVTFCLLVKFNTFEETKNEIPAPSELQVIALPKQKQIPPKESIKLKKSAIIFTYLILFRKIQRTKGETAERATCSSFKI
jgi:hypothetical protein